MTQTQERQRYVITVHYDAWEVYEVDAVGKEEAKEKLFRQDADVIFDHEDRIMVGYDVEEQEHE